MLRQACRRCLVQAAKGFRRTLHTHGSVNRINSLCQASSSSCYRVATLHAASGVHQQSAASSAVQSGTELEYSYCIENVSHRFSLVSILILYRILSPSEKPVQSDIVLCEQRVYILFARFRCCITIGFREARIPSGNSNVVGYCCQVFVFRKRGIMFC